MNNFLHCAIFEKQMKDTVLENTFESRVERVLGVIQGKLETLEKELAKTNNTVNVITKELAKVTNTVSGITEELTKINNTIAGILNRLFKVEQKLEELDTRTINFPKLYDNVDAMIGEIKENREERAFMNRRITNLEKQSFKLHDGENKSSEK